MSYFVYCDIITSYKGGGVKTQEQNKEQNNVAKKEHNRITLLGFFYTLCIISIISLVCLVYVLHLRNQKTEDRLNKLENSIQTIQTTQSNQ